jgi:hypothetical protein
MTPGVYSEPEKDVIWELELNTEPGFFEMHGYWLRFNSDPWHPDFVPNRLPLTLHPRLVYLGAL